MKTEIETVPSEFPASNSPADLEAFFWDWFPNEISWKEFQMWDPEMYARVQNVGQALVLMGKISGKILG